MLAGGVIRIAAAFQPGALRMDLLLDGLGLISVFGGGVIAITPFVSDTASSTVLREQ